MSNDSPADEEEIEAEAEEPLEASETETSEAVLDVESVEEQEVSTEELRETLDEQAELAKKQEQTIEELRETLGEQNERIEELEGLLTDLSARAADGDGTGVCPECHGPVVKRDPWFRRARIECTQCGEVFHEY